MTSKPITKSFNTPEKSSSNPRRNLSLSEPNKFIKSKLISTQENPPNISKENDVSKSTEIDFSKIPSFSQYINPQRLKPYDEMLKKNIRSFNLIPKGGKKIEINIEKIMKEQYSLDTPAIEINFKFTCDYELIESELKEFLELFGEINSLNYDMNINSLKINYKYYFSSMYVNYYLSNLIYENKRKNKYGNYLLFTKQDDELSDKKSNSSLNEKQSEDIFRFIKFLTENYKNEPKMKLNETPIKSTENKANNKLNDSTAKKKEDIYSEKKVENASYEKNDVNSDKKIYSNIINNPKNLNLLQNSETPIKKSNVFNNYSANNIFSSNKNIKNNKGGSDFSPAPLNPFNPSIKPPLLYMPFVPKMNVKMGIPIPVLFPIDSSFLKKKFSEKKFGHNSNKENKTGQNSPSSLDLNQKENKINSCLVEHGNNNPINSINIRDKIENETQIQNDNQIKEIFDNINNKIANISNNSNDSTNSNEKNNNIIINDNTSKCANSVSNDKSKSNSELDSSNRNMRNKSDSTIKTEKVNKSNNASDELNRIIDINDLELNKSNKSINSNEVNSKNNSSSDNKSGFMSSFKGKTLSLERLNNYLQANKPVSNFSNPVLSLNTENQSNRDKSVMTKNGEEKNQDNQNNNNINKEIPFSSSQNYSTAYPHYNNKEINNYINPMYNFLYLPAPVPEEFNQNSKPGKMLYPPIPFPYLPPPAYQNYFYKNNPINFDKDVIDFSKLTLETKNKVHFNTHSSRNYYYKYVCNYTVQIENDNLFMVTKRIIGKNGCFLKKILQESCIKYGDYSTKIRLRGKGSGYIDKVSNSDSEEPLMLSVSSLNYPTYYNCCLLVDNLMNKIYEDYYEHLHKVLPKELHYSIIKKKIIKNEFIVDRVNSMPFNNYFPKNNNAEENKKNSSNTKIGIDDKKDENQNENAKQ